MTRSTIRRARRTRRRATRAQLAYSIHHKHPRATNPFLRYCRYWAEFHRHPLTSPAA